MRQIRPAFAKYVTAFLKDPKLLETKFFPSFHHTEYLSMGGGISWSVAIQLCLSKKSTHSIVGIITSKDHAFIHKNVPINVLTHTPRGFSSLLLYTYNTCKYHTYLSIHPNPPYQEKETPHPRAIFFLESSPFLPSSMVIGIRTPPPPLPLLFSFSNPHLSSPILCMRIGIRTPLPPPTKD